MKVEVQIVLKCMFIISITYCLLYSANNQLNRIPLVRYFLSTLMLGIWKYEEIHTFQILNQDMSPMMML